MTEVECVKPKCKRDLFRINGNNPTVLNLEHVTRMNVQDKRITFNFLTDGITIDFETEVIAQAVFEQVLNVWAGDVEG